MTTDITEKIKTFEDAAKATGRPLTIDLSSVPEDLRKYFEEQYKMVVIAEALNEGWKPLDNLLNKKDMSLNNLSKQVHKNAVEKGFYKDHREIGTLLMLIVSELSEALEADRKGKIADLNAFYNSINAEEFKEAFEKTIKDTFEDEIADTMIRLFDLCGYLNIDIEKHIELKLKYNKLRERLHGKKY